MVKAESISAAGIHLSKTWMSRSLVSMVKCMYTQHWSRVHSNLKEWGGLPLQEDSCSDKRTAGLVIPSIASEVSITLWQKLETKLCELGYRELMVEV